MDFGSGAIDPVFGSFTSGSGGLALTTTAGLSAGTLSVGGLNTNTTYSGSISGTGGGHGRHGHDDAGRQQHLHRTDHHLRRHVANHGAM